MADTHGQSKTQNVNVSPDFEKQVADLHTKFDTFITTYELDMRGDKNLGNGNKGVIGEIRAFKELWSRYPSTLYLLSTKPFRTIGVVMLIFFFLDLLSTYGLLRAVMSAFGIVVPSIPSP